MTITRIKYEKLFPVGAYLNEKIGFEADVSGTQEDIISYLDQLRDLAERSHKEKYPHLYNDNQPEAVSQGERVIDLAKEREKERLEKLIDDSQSLEELVQYKDAVGKYGLVDFYADKLEQIQKA